MRQRHCPMPDCTTCRPEPEPLDIVAAQQRVRDLAYVAAWLIEHWPEAWYSSVTADLTKFAAGILEIKLRRAAGRGGR
jgi:hypothetical protein